MRRIWTEHLLPRRRYLVIAGIAMIVSAGTTGLVPIVIQQVADEIFIRGNQNLVYLLTIAVLVITVLKTVSEFVSKVTLNFLGNRFVADMRIQMFKKLIYADLSWIEGINSGRFVSGFLTDAVLLQNTASRAMIALGENLLKVIVLAVTMFVLDWRLASFIMLTMPIGLFLLAKQSKRTRKSTKQTLQETGDLSTLVTQALRSARVVHGLWTERSRNRKNIQGYRAGLLNFRCAVSGQRH